MLGWLRLILATASRCILTLTCSLLFWAAAPALIGWHPTTVLTGSMTPAIDPGDVIVSRPVDPTHLRKGDVVLVHDPVHHGRLLLHRFVRLRADHRLELRGDANGSDDSTPVSPGAVVGTAAMRVPWVGRPWFWIVQRQWGHLAALALLLALAVAGSRLDRRHRPAPAGDQEAADTAAVITRGGRHRAVVTPRRRRVLRVVPLP